MIHYHGSPITPKSIAINLLRGRHAMVSYANPEQVELAAELCQSFALDNGAFSIWKSGFGEVNVELYAAWVRRWIRHPGFDWCLIPDTIEGDESQNNALLTAWLDGQEMPRWCSVPVWHLHESLDRLELLCRNFPRVALGSSGQWSSVGTADWWERMAEAMDRVCNAEGQPMCKLHGLRMLSPTVFSHLPPASADSTNVARNAGIDSKWRGTYLPASKSDRALILANRIEAHASASHWNRCNRGVQENRQLLG